MMARLQLSFRGDLTYFRCEASRILSGWSSLFGVCSLISYMHRIQDHWLTHEGFKVVELQRRKANAGDVLSGRLFVSHCWRMTSMQARKRQMIAGLSAPVKVTFPEDHRYCLRSSVAFMRDCKESGACVTFCSLVPPCTISAHSLSLPLQQKQQHHQFLRVRACSALAHGDLFFSCVQSGQGPGLAYWADYLDLQADGCAAARMCDLCDYSPAFVLIMKHPEKPD